AGPGFHEPLQGFEQSRLLKLAGFSAGAGPTLLARRRCVGVVQFSDAITNGPIGKSRRSRHRLNATPSQRACFRRSPASSGTLVQVRSNRGVLLTNPFNDLCVWHSWLESPTGRVEVNSNSGNLLLSASQGASGMCAVRMDQFLELLHRAAEIVTEVN